MRECSSEADFGKWVVAAIDAAGGHVQVHREQVDIGIPDISAAAFGKDYWLELKYGEFSLGREKYDKFEFKEVTRLQLDWLTKRAAHGEATCGILGYFVTKQSSLPWVFFMTARQYLEMCWRSNGTQTVGSIMLSPYAVPADNIKRAEDLLVFIHYARWGMAWCPTT